MSLSLSRAEDMAMAHDMGTGLTAPDWPNLQPGEISELLAHFPLLRGAGRIEWHSPRPFCAAARVHTSDGEVFVKRHHQRVRDIPSLLEEHRFIEHLRSRGISVPSVLGDRDGRTAIAVDQWTFEVHALAPGVDAYRDTQSWMPARSVTHALSLGRALARLHLAADGYAAPARAPSPLLASFDIVGADALGPALERYVARRPAVAEFLAGAGGLAPIQEALGPLHASLRPLLRDFPPLWVHNDWHASNLFWTDRSDEARVRAVIDFGLCNLGCAAVDLATALERNTISWLNLGDDAAASAATTGRVTRDGKPWGGVTRGAITWDNAGQTASGNGEMTKGGVTHGGVTIGNLELAQAVLDGYCSVRHLSAAEREALPLLMPLAHVEYALSEVDYFHGVVANDANARLAYPKFLLGHVRWFAGRHGREYLDGLRSWLRSPGQPR
jgi:Ser/Thr protein kinase RdoA (MazF antagonist)